MSLLVLLGSGLFLASIAFLDQIHLQLILLAVFLFTGWLVLKKAGTSYLLFAFVFPFLPSQSPQISAFDYLEFLFLSFAFWWAFARIRKGDWRLPQTRLTPFLSIFFVALFLSVFLALLRHNYLLSEVFLLKLKDSWNIFRVNSAGDLNPLRVLIYLLEGVIFFYVTVDLVESSRIRTTARIFCSAAAVVCFIGVLQYIFRVGLLQYWVIENPNLTRINALFSDPNSLGTYISSFLCLNVIAFLIRRPLNPYFLVSTVLMLLAVLFTASRAAWGAIFLTLLLFPAAAKWILRMDLSRHLRGASLWIARRGPILAAGILGLLILAGIALNYAGSRPDSLWKVAVFTFNPKLSVDEILKGRIQIWENALLVFRDEPLFGSGVGSFPALTGAPYFITTAENVHNYFLQILVEAGLPAFVAFIAVIAVIVRHSSKRLRALAGDDFLLLFGFLSALICFLLTSITGHPLLLLKLQLVFWGIVGILMKDSHGVDQDSGPDRPAENKKWFRIAALVIALTAVGLFAFKTRNVLETRELPSYDHGFSVWEKDEQGNLFRWTTGESISTLERRGNVISIRLRQLHPDVLRKPTYAKLYLNGELLDTIRFSDTNWKELKYFLPPFAGGKYIKIRIVPEKVYMPPNPRDERKLGVAVRGFHWECSPTGPIGVYERENEGSSIYYWTGQRASFPLRQGGDVLSFRVLPNASAQKAPLETQFFWEDRLLHTLNFTEAGWKPVVLRIPGNGPSRGVLTIRVSRTSSQASLNLGSDARELGVRVEMPFRWGGATPRTSDTYVPLSGVSLYGISNNQNYPFRLLAYPQNSRSGPVQIRSRGKALPQRQGLSRLVSHAAESWSRVYSRSETSLDASFVWQTIENQTDIPPGPVLIRIRASGHISGGDVPLMSLVINDREVARQPVVYEAAVDYYFPVYLSQPGKKLAVRFLNDLYRPAENVDRNLFVYHIDLLPNVSAGGMERGWELFRDGILIAEGIDRNFPFHPQNCCYTVTYRK